MQIPTRVRTLASVSTTALVVLSGGFALCCSSGGGSNNSPTSPSTPTAAAVATVTLSQPADSVVIGSTLQLSATPKDAGGNTLTGRTVTWLATPATVATVTSAGVVTPVGPGTATVTATSETKSASTTVRVVRAAVTPFLQKPFAGEFLVSNPMDHDTPIEFIDTNGRFVTSWGEPASAVDGHAGYDFMMPVGTPIFAAAAGVVTLAAPVTFFCPLPGLGNVTQRGIVIRHDLGGGNSYQTYYAHTSREDVTLGQVVTAGQQIALSGNTGCTTAPHLHLQLDRIGTNDVLTTVDPYGWTGAQPDPWEVNPAGAKSIYLWKSGQAPEMFVGQNTIVAPLNLPGNSPTPKAVVISAVRWMGPHDELNPNNEAVDIQIDPAVSSAASMVLTGYYLKNNNGDRFNFPAGFILARGTTVRVYVGSGTNTATTLYWGRPAGIFNNLGDCAELFDASGGYYLSGWATSCR